MPSSSEHYHPSKHHKVLAQHYSITSLSLLSLLPGNLHPQEQVVQQMYAEGVTHCQWFTEHQNTVWLLKHWDQTHVVKKVGQKLSYNWELLVLQEGCCRTDHVYIGDPQNVNSVTRETI